MPLNNYIAPQSFKQLQRMPIDVRHAQHALQTEEESGAIKSSHPLTPNPSPSRGEGRKLKLLLRTQRYQLLLEVRLLRLAHGVQRLGEAFLAKAFQGQCGLEAYQPAIGAGN